MFEFTLSDTGSNPVGGEPVDVVHDEPLFAEYETEAPGGLHTILLPSAETAIALVPPPDVPPGLDAKLIQFVPPFVE